MTIAEASESTAPLTIGQYLTLLLPRLAQSRQRHAPQWPADVFALAMSLIQRSGVYTFVLNDWPPLKGDSDTVGDWAKRMTDLGREWRRIAGESAQPAPTFVRERWKTLMEAFSEEIGHIKQNTVLAHTLFKLSAIADEASAGTGLPGSSSGPREFLRFYRRARRQLLPGEKGSSLWRLIKLVCGFYQRCMRLPKDLRFVRSRTTLHFAQATKSAHFGRRPLRIQAAKEKV
jgi:hypothetical protein